ncbi:MAG: citramalate synthase [Caldilineaceae bacterium]|nr:citramalate synthase [Caldilineaceae bacterium]MBP8121326.1 citramalate synthase [Caldilineaceae bacterium]MBP9070892.1 citramalate synthase [Caldilineaceae bacterium]
MHIQIYDTTLRDGTQGEGVNLSAEDKLKIARRLDDFGVDYIEGGWPGSNPKDMEFFDRAQRELSLRHAKVTAFGSTCRADTDPADDPQIQLLIQANTPVVTLFGKTWDMHVTEVLRTTLPENLRMIRASVAYLKAQGKEVVYDAEHFFDGYKANPEYALSTLQAAMLGGADSVVLCDTNGGGLPWQVGEAIDDVRRELGLDGSSPISDRVTLGIHAHNDSETGVANTLEAVRRGAVQVQGTINGYGERCGNANLISVIPDLQLKMGYNCVPPEKLSHLTEISRYVSELANLSPEGHQPFVGQSAFAHKGGTHVNAVVKNVMSYQHIEPGLVGNETRVLLSELSGKDNIAVKRKEFGLKGLSLAEEREVLQQIKELENAGFAFESAEASVDLMLRRVRPGYVSPFEMIDYTAAVEHRRGRGMFSEGTVKVQVGDQILHEVAEGNGPVNALNRALRKALAKYYPRLRAVHLTDYKVRILDSASGTAAMTRVLIDFADGERTWTTVGASTNIIEASWIALSDSVEYFIITDREAQAKLVAAAAEPVLA